MTADTFQVSLSQLKFIGMAVGSLASTGVGILWKMDKTLTRMALADAVYKQKTESRLATLERHDRRNAEESRAMMHYLIYGGAPQHDHAARPPIIITDPQLGANR